MRNIFEMVGAAFLTVLTIMSALWVVYFFKRNAGIVDIGWGLAFFLTMTAYLFIGDGALFKKGLLAIMVWIWSGRLTWYIFQRYLNATEDFRYQNLRREWGEKDSDFKFLMLFLFQGILVLLLSLPFLVVAHASTSTWSEIELLGFVVWAGGIVGEAIADNDLKKYKSNPENKGKICKEGLWKYSRHPNYFFEFVVWIGFSLFALGTSGGWIGILSPILMYVLLTKISGIPLVEAESEKNKGEEFLKYQKSTNAFIPWFPKND